MPVYPQLIHGVHQVPGMIPTHINHPSLPPPVHVPVLPAHPSAMVTAPPMPVEVIPQDGKNF